jgi:hypothetical protein
MSRIEVRLSHGWAGRSVAREAEKLRELASWYRDYAERTGNLAIWDARIRTAEELEAGAARLEGDGARRALAVRTA